MMTRLKSCLAGALQVISKRRQPGYWTSETFPFVKITFMSG